jgi:hypothetical protein
MLSKEFIQPTGNMITRGRKKAARKEDVEQLKSTTASEDRERLKSTMASLFGVLDKLFGEVRRKSRAAESQAPDLSDLLLELKKKFSLALRGIDALQWICGYDIHALQQLTKSAQVDINALASPALSKRSVNELYASGVASRALSSVRQKRQKTAEAIEASQARPKMQQMFAKTKEDSAVANQARQKRKQKFAESKTAEASSSALPDEDGPGPGSGKVGSDHVPDSTVCVSGGGLDDNEDKLSKEDSGASSSSSSQARQKRKQKFAESKEDSFEQIEYTRRYTAEEEMRHIDQLQEIDWRKVTWRGAQNAKNDAKFALFVAAHVSGINRPPPATSNPSQILDTSRIVFDCPCLTSASESLKKKAWQEKQCKLEEEIRNVAEKLMRHHYSSPIIASVPYTEENFRCRTKAWQEQYRQLEAELSVTAHLVQMHRDRDPGTGKDATSQCGEPSTTVVPP